jgi:hypothetical protein
MKSLSHLVNPISIVAVFAALCEASATTVLPHLDEGSRQIYIWFLIAFPSTLVVLFFLTLNFNSQVLYGPDTSISAKKTPEPEPPENDGNSAGLIDQQARSTD